MGSAVSEPIGFVGQPSDGQSVLDDFRWPVRSVWGPAAKHSPTLGKPQPAPVEVRWGLGDVWWGLAVGVCASTVGGVGWSVYQVLPQIVVSPNTIDPSALSDQIADGLSSAAQSPGFVLWSLVLLWIGLVGAPLRATWLKGARSLAVDFGWVFHWGRDIAIGLGVGIAMRATVTVASAAVVAVGVPSDSVGNSGFLGSGSGAVIVLTVVASGVGGPVVEELFFRGLCLSALLRRLCRIPSRLRWLAPCVLWAVALGLVAVGVWIGFSSWLLVGAAGVGGVGAAVRWLRGPVAGQCSAAVLSSGLFGLAHVQLAAGGIDAGAWFIVGSTAVLGLVLALLRLRSGRLGGGVVAHVVFNCSGVALALLFG